MLINNASVFNTLIGTGAPSLAYTSYDPVDNWARTELETLNPGTILIQLDQDCPSGCDLIQVWAKRSRTPGNGSRDYISLGTQGFIGEVTPNASDPDLCAAPIGSIYVKKDADNCVLQLYMKINNTCSDVSICRDWHPMLLEVTRSGSTFSFDATNYILNVPTSGNLAESSGNFVWTPDDGSDAITVYIPTLTDNEDGTYTFSPGGTAPNVTITATVPSIPADISAVSRPWVKEGSAAATNATNVGVADDIFHTGKLVRGATAIGSTDAAAELIGNNALGAGNHDMTSASNSTVGGSSSEVKSTSNSAALAGQNNIVTGATAPSTNINMAIIAGRDNTITDSPDAVIGGGGSNAITASASAFIGGGSANQIDTGGQAFIGGGNTNRANGTEAGVLAGRFNEANASIATALGLKSQITHAYAFLVNTLPGANVNTDTDPFASASDSEFAVRCDNVRIFTNLAQSAGVTMAAGGSSWSAVSDRRTKDKITLLDVSALEAYRSLQVVSYQQGSDDIGAGVVAQNFYDSFDWLKPKMIGEMYAINQMEHDGVQDKAIQELTAYCDALHLQNRALHERLTSMEKRLSRYEGGE